MSQKRISTEWISKLPFVLHGMPGEVGDSLAAPLSHSQVGMLAYDQEVVGDGSPDNVDPIQVDEGSLQKLPDGKERRLAVAGRQFHTLIRQVAQGFDLNLAGILSITFKIYFLWPT